MPRFPDTAIDTLPERAGPASAVRSAVLGLFGRLGVRPAGDDDTLRVPLLEGVTPEPAPSPDHRAADRALRERAHLAYATVEGAGPAALDLALDVLAAELDAVRGRACHRAEALKAIGLYAPEPWVRRIAQHALAAPAAGAAIPLPAFLAAPCTGAGERAGGIRRHG